MAKNLKKSSSKKNKKYIDSKQQNRKTTGTSMNSSKLSSKVSSTRQNQIGAIQTLSTFLAGGTGRLTLADRKIIVEQSLALLEGTYVHLPLKKAMHAVDPLQKLKLLQLRLDQTNSNQMEEEIYFHKEMIEIFTSVRDLHTNYILPKPFSDHLGFLPFQVESYVKSNRRHFLVTRVFEDFRDIFPATFKPGVEVTYWNGIPMERAVEINANKNAGSNLPARFARGLESMTFRPMAGSLPPDEEWVVIVYKTESGEDLEYRQEWLIYSPDPADVSLGDTSADSQSSYKLGLDLTTDLVRQIKKILFAPKFVIEGEQDFAKVKSVKTLIKNAEGLVSVMPQIFQAKKISENIGYIRIYTFNVNDDVSFINEFLRLINQLPKKGLIVDVRGNGGGLITAAERLLQLLCPQKITPQPFQFISSPITIEMTRRISWLKSWEESLLESVTTGSIFSRGFTITSIEEANDLGQQYHGPVILITNALCYSATDLFAAGFQDHDIGPILGTDGNTGAGGANVWTHNLVKQILAGTKYELKTLPSGSDMRVSIRRNVRIGERTGTPIEDLGIIPDIRYNMTREDLLNNNVDLIKKASEILSGMPVRQLDVSLNNQDGSLEIEMITFGISRVDLYVDRRPITSQDIDDGINKVSIDEPSSSARLIEIEGIKENKIVATRKIYL